MKSHIKTIAQEVMAMGVIALVLGLCAFFGLVIWIMVVGPPAGCELGMTDAVC